MPLNLPRASNCRGAFLVVMRVTLHRPGGGRPGKDWMRPVAGGAGGVILGGDAFGQHCLNRANGRAMPSLTPVGALIRGLSRFDSERLHHHVHLLPAKLSAGAPDEAAASGPFCRSGRRVCRRFSPLQGVPAAGRPAGAVASQAGAHDVVSGWAAKPTFSSARMARNAFRRWPRRLSASGLQPAQERRRGTTPALVDAGIGDERPWANRRSA